MNDILLGWFIGLAIVALILAIVTDKDDLDRHRE